jgi:hypothetical protein
VIWKGVKAAFLIACGLMIYAYLQAPTSAPILPTTTAAVSPTPVTIAPTTAAPAQSILDNVKLSKVSVSKDEVTMTASFTIENKNAFPIKDVEITCHHFANSGTEIDSNTRTVYEIVPAKGSKRVNAFSMGFIHSQAAKSACAPIGAKAS